MKTTPNFIKSVLCSMNSYENFENTYVHRITSSTQLFRGILSIPTFSATFGPPKIDTAESQKSTFFFSRVLELQLLHVCCCCCCCCCCCIWPPKSSPRPEKRTTSSTAMFYVQNSSQKIFENFENSAKSLTCLDSFSSVSTNFWILSSRTVRTRPYLAPKIKNL